MGDIPIDKYYVTPQDIRDALGVDYTTGAFSDTALNARIESAMKKVDYITNMVWNGRRRKVREWHTLPRYHGGWLAGVGYPIYLGHSYVRDITSLKVYANGGYQEWIGVYPNDRGDFSWWLQDIDGILYIRRWVFKYTAEEVQVEYIYGRDDLPFYVVEMTKYYVMRGILMSSRFIEDMPESAGIDLKTLLKEINDRLDTLVSRHYAMRKPVNQVDLGEVVVV